MSLFQFETLLSDYLLYLAIAVLIVLIIFIIHLLLCRKLAKLAEAKGYSRRAYFHLCFWIGLGGYIIVAALPDRALHQKIEVLHRDMPKAPAPTEPPEIPFPLPYRPAPPAFAVPITEEEVLPSPSPRRHRR